MAQIGVAYPRPVYIPILPIFNPAYFPTRESVTTTGGGGGGGQTNIFPLGLSSGNLIVLDGGTSAGTGNERGIDFVSVIKMTDTQETIPSNYSGLIQLDTGVLTIGNPTPSTGIVIELQGSSLLFNGSPISGNGDALLAGGTSSVPQTFTGYNEFKNTDGQITLWNTTDTTYGDIKVNLSCDPFNYQLDIGGNLSIGNTANSNNIVLSSSANFAGQLDIAGQVNVFSQTYPNTIDTNYLATIGFVNAAVSGIVGGDVLAGGNNTFTGNNSFSTPATSQSFNNQLVNINGGSLKLQTSANSFPITITNQSTSASNNILRFQPNLFLGAGTYIFQTYLSNYVNTATIDNTGIALIATPFKSSLNTTPNLTQLPTNYSCFYSNNQQPYFAYNNAGSIITTQLVQNSILGTFTSAAGYIDTGNIIWSFSTIPNNTLGQQFSFAIICNVGKSNSSSPYLTNDELQLNSNFTNAMSVSGNAILLPFKFSNGAVPVPIITNTTGYVFNIVSNIGGLTINSIIQNAGAIGGVQYQVSANITNTPYTVGSILTFYAFNPIF